MQTDITHQLLPGMVFYDPQKIGQPSWVINSIVNGEVELHQFSKINSIQVRTVAQLHQAINDGLLAPVHKHNEMIKHKIITWKKK